MAKAYDGFTGKWVEADKHQAAMAKAHEGGDPLVLPSDRTKDELDRLDPAFAGPVITTGAPAGSDAAAAGAGAGTGRGATTGGGSRAT